MIKFTKLFEPVKIGSIEIKNRIVMAPMITNFADFNGGVTNQQIDYFVERAKGGAGLITMAWAIVSKFPSKGIGCVYIDNDEYIRKLEELTRAVHLNGAKISLQLAHAGRQVTIDDTGGRQPVSASNVSYREGESYVKARALSISEIEKLVEDFGEGARRAKLAGFDAVDLHGANGYLIAQFLSPYTNKRTDRYGGNFTKRMRFAMEILESVREKVGKSFPIIFRISADEFVDGGLKLDDTKKIARSLQAGGIDAIHINAGIAETYHKAMPPADVRRGCFIHFAEAIKKVVNVPVIAVGRINDPYLAEKILQEKKADLIAMGRALLADPDLPKKAAEGRLNDIRKCIACNRGCVMRMSQKLHIMCAINPAVGKEKEYAITPAKMVKRVIIVGGGPAGMEAARVAALRGHKVTLFEKNNRLGGQLLLASWSPYKEEIKNELEYLPYQLKKLGVKIKTGQLFKTDRINKINPDAIIVATGAKPYVPSIPGIGENNVVTAWDVLAGKARVNNDVVIVGGGMVGCETAEFLGLKGKKVLIIEQLAELAINAEPFSRIYLLERLAKLRIKSLTNVNVLEINDSGVTFQGKKSGRKFVGADTVVIAAGSVPERELVIKLGDKVTNLYTVGDCVKPRYIMDAVHEGFHVARSL